MTDVPTMDEVLKGAPKNWGKWGEEDEVGALNYLTTEEVFRGVRHIKSGTVFTLQRLIGDPKGDPVWPGRTPAEKTMILDESSWDSDGAPQFPGGLHYADDKISAFLQGSTQYDVAVLCYTSGTTGVPKGAMCTHGTMVFNSQTYRDWMGFTAEDSVLGVAPLFHITGLIGHMGVALLAACPLVINHRFEAGVVIDAIREHQPTFTVGSITVFINLSGLEGVAREDWSSFRMIYSGGAPIAPAITDQFMEKTGLYIHNIYGLTETNSPSHAVPLGKKAPVDPNTGALSVGVPVFNTVVRILDEAGKEVPVGQIGEIATSGPQVVPGYWNKPEATAESLPGGELRTGDVGFMDPDGWFYLVDRKKDMINAAGYKVWPREVEDVLYGHPAVREAAVVGVPDEYRGETVKAYVSLKPGATVTEEELIGFCKQQMAAYKYPRSIEFVDDLPKTTTGKILRRELRDSNP